MVFQLMTWRFKPLDAPNFVMRLVVSLLFLCAFEVEYRLIQCRWQSNSPNLTPLSLEMTHEMTQQRLKPF